MTQQKYEPVRRGLVECSQAPSSLGRFCPLTPTDKQREFLVATELEVLFGGAVGGGKSLALLMAALQYVHVPGYSALILRKDTQRLALAGGLIPRSHEWLADKEAATWNAARRQWSFRTTGAPATITFGYLATPLDKYRYASSEYQLIAFDELTELPEADYLFLFSRLRRAKVLEVPLRMRSASNPGNIGHQWVKQRFVVGQSSRFKVQSSKLGEADSTLNLEPGTLNSTGTGPRFIPSRLADNPHLDADEYRRSLVHLDPLTRERLVNGDWSVQEQALARPEWLRYYTESRPLTPSGASERENVIRQSTLTEVDGFIAAQLPHGVRELRRPLTPSGASEREDVARQLFSTGVDRVAAAQLPHGVRELHYPLNLLAPDGRLLAAVDPETCRRFITVDPAGTSADRAKEVRGRERSYTVCQVWDQPRGELCRFLILRHQVRGHFGFGQIKQTLEELHAQWRPERIWIENEKLGIATVDQLAPRLPIAAIPTRGRDKAVRASRLLHKLERGEVFLPAHENSWRHGLEAELLSWTGDEREPADQIDAAAYAAIIADTAAPGILRIEPVVMW